MKNILQKSIVALLICVCIKSEGKSLILSKIPFLKIGAHTYINVKVNGSKKPYLFIFDTGAGGSVVTKELVEELNLNLTKNDTALEMSGNVENVKMSLNNSISLEDEKIDGINFYVQSALPSNGITSKVYGAIGYDLLSKYLTKINYEANYIELYPPGTSIDIKYDEIPFTLYEGIPVIENYITTFSGKKIKTKLVIDSGAGFSVSLNSSFFNKYQLENELKNKVKVSVTGASVNNPFDNYLSSLLEINVGNFEFKDVPINISLAKEGASSTEAIDGVIGLDIIERFNLVLDYKNGFVKFIPNKNFNNPFKFNLSGLNFTKNKDGEVYISKILEHSPAVNSDLKVNDIIIGINNKKTSDINEIKNELNSTEKIVNLSVLREGKKLEIEIETKRFY